MEDISQSLPPQSQDQQNQHEASEKPRQEEQAPRHGSYESPSTSPTRSTASDSVMSTAPSTPELRPEDGDGGAETPKMTTRQPPPPQHFTPHDSLVTVRLSEPPTLTLDTSVGQQSPPRRRVSEPEMGQMLVGPEGREEAERKEEQVKEEAITEEQEEDEDEVAPDTPTDARRASAASKSSDGPRQSLEDELREEEEEKGEPVAVVADGETQDGRPASLDASDEEVDWDELQKSEDRETKTEDTDNSTAMLLARLEQENAKLATNPKMAKVRAVNRITKSTRPPSMAQLRSMVSGPTPAALRYSMIPPPPMTDLEFYAALVKDYEQTASRLPTLLSNKIHKGIPPPLRGVVWQSMSGARDGHLEDQYERLSGETSPHEPVIIKDLGRSFPGVDMFRDPEGDGQRMLGRVLKCYSIYDPKIGYCQGLAFLVGPLLMHMPDKAAFCVLVRLMERYDLRSCFLPDLPGLHTRIYQFRELLRQMLPGLSSHLDDLQADPAYVSQWFLSFFAVTAPLPMLFRIYDVVFAEGASESLMRVALCLMRKNQGRLLACTELEDAMQLLLSRGLWDCYHYNADEFVRDFVSLTGVVSRDKLKRLEREFREEGQQQQQATSGAARASAVTSAASRFLGRIWASSSSASVSASTSSSSSLSSSASPRPASTLSPTAHAPPPPPPSQPPRPFSMLRRTTSKQSLASTLNSLEASSSSVVSSVASTAATSRDSSSGPDAPSAVPSAAAAAPGHGAKHTEEKYLHSQIEDLLTALSELQRDQALLADDLQREREEREDDRRAMQRLLGKLRREGVRGGPASTGAGAGAGDQTTRDEQDKEGQAESKEAEAETSTQQHTEGGLWISSPSSPSPDRALSDVIAMMELRFGTDLEPRPSSGGQSKTQLRSELARTHQQLETAASQTQDLNRKVYDFEQTVNGLKDQLRESHVHIRSLHQDKQRLEKQVRTMRVRASAASEHSTLDGGAGGRDDWHGSGSGAGGGAAPAAVASTSGLRELKLGRSRSTPNQTSPFARRGSSMARNAESTLGVPAGPAPPESGGGAPSPPVHEADALLLELVQAKTAEAMAKQEAEEAKQKLENLRKALGISAAAAADQQQQQQYHNNHSQHHHHSSSSAAAGTVSSAASAAMGVFGRLTGSGPATAIESGAVVGNSINNNRPATANSTSSAVTMMMTTAVGPTSSPSNGASKPTPPVGAGTAAAGGGFWGGWRRS